MTTFDNETGYDEKPFVSTNPTETVRRVRECIERALGPMSSADGDSPERERERLLRTLSPTLATFLPYMRLTLVPVRRSESPEEDDSLEVHVLVALTHGHDRHGRAKLFHGVGITPDGELVTVLHRVSALPPSQLADDPLTSKMLAPAPEDLVYPSGVAAYEASTFSNDSAHALSISATDIIQAVDEAMAGRGRMASPERARTAGGEQESGVPRRKRGRSANFSSR